MVVLGLFLSTVFPFGEVVMQDYWMRFLKFKKDVLVLYWILRFRLESCRYFWNLGVYPCINQIFIERKLLLLNKIFDGPAPDYLSEKLLSLKYHKSHDTRSRLPHCLPIPRTNSIRYDVIVSLQCS